MENKSSNNLIQIPTKPANKHKINTLKIHKCLPLLRFQIILMMLMIRSHHPANFLSKSRWRILFKRIKIFKNMLIQIIIPWKNKALIQIFIQIPQRNKLLLLQRPKKAFIIKDLAKIYKLINIKILSIAYNNSILYPSNKGFDQQRILLNTLMMNQNS